MTKTRSDTRYAAAMRSVMEQMERAYLRTSVPAPHPVWWKRLLRRPYRKTDLVAYMAALQDEHRAAKRRVT